MGFCLCIKWTSKSVFKPYLRDVWIVKRSFCPVVKSWFFVSSGDDILRKTIGGSDRSGLRRRDVLGPKSGWYRMAS